MKLGELLVRNNLITVTQLQQALKAQSIYGGKLGTNLVELGYMSESDLAQFLAKQLNMEAVEPKDFSNISPETIRAVPADIAGQFRIVPLHLDGTRLKVAFADPLDLTAREELSFKLGKSIVPVVATELLIHYGLEKYYGIRREERGLSLDSDQDGNEEMIIEDISNASFLSDEMDLQQEQVLESIGHYNTSDLSRDLSSASSKDEVFRCLFRFMETLCKQSAVFIGRKQDVWCWMQQGFHPQVNDVRFRACSFTDDSTIAEVFRNKDMNLRPTFTEIDKKIVTALGGDVGVAYLLVPIIMSGRVIATFLATSGTLSLTPKVEANIGSIHEAVTKGGIAFQIVGLRQRLLSSPQGPCKAS